MNIPKATIEQKFESTEEIDNWYKQTMDGLSRIAASLIDVQGLECLNNLGGSTLFIETSSLARIRKLAYETVVGCDAEPSSYITFEDMVRKYAKF